MYPILVLLLVEKNRSLNSTHCSFATIIDVRGSRPELEPMSFAPGPILSGDQTGSATKPPNLDVHTHISFDPTSEPGDA